MRYTASIMDENRFHVLKRAADAYGLEVEFPEPRALVPGTNRILNSEPTGRQIKRLQAQNGIRKMSNSSDFAYVPTAAQGLTPLQRAWLRTIRYAEGTNTIKATVHTLVEVTWTWRWHPDRNQQWI